ncbi:MAG: putative metal-dependent hydrolase [Bacteroidota bacterium]|nr:putative metal-dependent hydrolase [Bacteroidota bacterium]MDP4232665.1 putative metal-dependent hydrolase [Bacteroidota bacterium]MDP4243202.1 putative metal-dependent hydrolase [Bacteroidota bacterium]MDP4288414.1 putative metal-dependent hydrolase [Bacteroidota bacterium]
MTITSCTEKIESIRALPERLTDAVRGLTEAQLDTPYRDGGWSPRQIVHHVADAHMNAFVRMMLILTEDHPKVKPYEQDAWAKTSSYKGPLEPSLAIIGGLHSRMASLFESLGDGEWSRTMNHPERGDESLETVLEMYANHGRAHVEQILSLRRQRGW